MTTFCKHTYVPVIFYRCIECTLSDQVEWLQRLATNAAKLILLRQACRTWLCHAQALSRLSLIFASKRERYTRPHVQWREVQVLTQTNIEINTKRFHNSFIPYAIKLHTEIRRRLHAGYMQLTLNWDTFLQCIHSVRNGIIILLFYYPHIVHLSFPFFLLFKNK